jgi:DNA ligase-1
LDGVRLLVSKDGGISRTGKVVPGTEILGKDLEEGQYVDGEAFDPKLDFEELTSTFKTDPSKLKFHVFDYFDLNKLNMTFEERWEKVKSLKNPQYEYVKTTLVMLRDDVPSIHKHHVEEGHEGTMIRDKDSVYEVGQRSNYLLKFKDFQTEEYPIIDVKEGVGRDKGAVIWVCKAGDQLFSVRPEGTLEVRRAFLEEKDKYIGKQLTVRFQNLTTLGVPRFPIGVTVRDYE